MDYRRIYNQIVGKAKGLNRVKNNNSYYESHHIIPKCLGGRGKKWDTNHPNIVLLTAREHFLCHRLLCKIYPNNKGIIYAFWMMSNGCYSNKHERYIPDSRAYGEAKLLFIQNKKGVKQSEKTIAQRVNKTKGQKRTQETCSKISESKKGNQNLKGYKYTNQQKLNQSLSHIGKSRSEEFKKSQSQKLKGIIFSEERKINISKSKMGDKNHMWGIKGSKNSRSKICYQYDLEGNFIREWPNGKIASEELNLNYQSINNCLKNKIKTSGGYIWKYS